MEISSTCKPMKETWIKQFGSLTATNGFGEDYYLWKNRKLKTRLRFIYSDMERSSDAFFILSSPRKFGKTLFEEVYLEENKHRYWDLANKNESAMALAYAMPRHLMAHRTGYVMLLSEEIDITRLKHSINQLTEIPVIRNSLKAWTKTIQNSLSRIDKVLNNAKEDAVTSKAEMNKARREERARQDKIFFKRRKRR